MSATGRSAAAETGYVRHPDDFFATPAWATRAILPFVLGGGEDVLDPCSGGGAILDVAKAGGAGDTFGIELDPIRWGEACERGHAVACADALDPHTRWPAAVIVTNPPYRAAMPFVLRALVEAGGQRDLAFLLRLNWLASQKRAAFHRSHPCDLYVLPRRPSFTGGGTDATEYAWFVWGPARGGRWTILETEGGT